MLINNQIENSLINRIRSLYVAELERQPSRITCQLLEGQLAILLEDALTQPERLLFDRGRTALVQQVRQGLHEILKPRVRAVIEEVIQVPILDLMMAAQLETGYVSFVAVLGRPQNLANLVEPQTMEMDADNAAP